MNCSKKRCSTVQWGIQEFTKTGMSGEVAGPRQRGYPGFQKDWLFGWWAINVWLSVSDHRVYGGIGMYTLCSILQLSPFKWTSAMAPSYYWWAGVPGSRVSSILHWIGHQLNILDNPFNTIPTSYSHILLSQESLSLTWSPVYNT